MNTPILFFRNDDVGSTLDKSLVKMTNIFIKHEIPIVHAVEPANLTTDVINWLIETKNNSNNLVEIIQHGFNHNKDNKYYQMEFGGKRNYKDQFSDIQKGCKLMNLYFDHNWEKIFTFPYGRFNDFTIKAINDMGYKGISSVISFNKKNLFKNYLGRRFKKNLLFNKVISYHLGKRPASNIWEVSISINIIRKFVNKSEAIHNSYYNIINSFNTVKKKTSVIGILLHHHFHNDHLKLIEDLIIAFKSNHYKFSKISAIIDEISK